MCTIQSVHSYHFHSLCIIIITITTLHTGNINVGDGAVIEAYTVVTKPVSPFSRVSGVPGRVVANYSVPEQVRGLLQRGWPLGEMGGMRGGEGFVGEEGGPKQKICFHGQGVGS